MPKKYNSHPIYEDDEFVVVYNSATLTAIARHIITQKEIKIVSEGKITDPSQLMDLAIKRLRNRLLIESVQSSKLFHPPSEQNY